MDINRAAKYKALFLDQKTLSFVIKEMTQTYLPKIINLLYQKSSQDLCSNSLEILQMKLVKKITKYATVGQKSQNTVTTQLCMQYHFFEPPQKVRNTSRSTLILFLENPQDYEVFKTVCIAIVARLDPTH